MYYLNHEVYLCTLLQTASSSYINNIMQTMSLMRWFRHCPIREHNISNWHEPRKNIYTWRWWRASLLPLMRDNTVAAMCLEVSPASSIWSFGDPWSMYRSGSVMALHCTKDAQVFLFSCPALLIKQKIWSLVDLYCISMYGEVITETIILWYW